MIQGKADFSVWDQYEDVGSTVRRIVNGTARDLTITILSEHHGYRKAARLLRTAYEKRFSPMYLYPPPAGKTPQSLDLRDFTVIDDIWLTLRRTSEEKHENTIPWELGGTDDPKVNVEALYDLPRRLDHLLSRGTRIGQAKAVEPIAPPETEEASKARDPPGNNDLETAIDPDDREGRSEKDLRKSEKDRDDGSEGVVEEEDDSDEDAFYTPLRSEMADEEGKQPKEKQPEAESGSEEGEVLE